MHTHTTSTEGPRRVHIRRGDSTWKRPSTGMSESLGAARSGMTFEAALAERAGLSEKAIGTLERGDRTTPRPATVVLLAQAVGACPAERERLLGTARAEQHPRTETRQPTERAGGTEKVPPETDPASLAQHGLLVPPPPLLDRQQDIAAISQLVSPSGAAVRLLTLIGPGGVDKTRLALAAALELVDTFADDVWFVALRDRQLLLVQDNFDHVLDAAPLVADLLSKCPRLSVLVTSRSRISQASGGRSLTATPGVHRHRSRFARTPGPVPPHRRRREHVRSVNACSQLAPRNQTSQYAPNSSVGRRLAPVRPADDRDAPWPNAMGTGFHSPRCGQRSAAETSGRA